MSVIVGLDLSLTSTGIVRTEPGDTDWLITPDRIQPKSTGHIRLDYLLGAISRACLGASLVVMEGPAFGAKGSAYHQLAGLWWLIKHQLWTDGRPVAVASPFELKKYACGTSLRIGKDEVLAAAVRRFPDVQVSNNDVADALWLAAMGARYLGVPIDEVPAAHQTALAKVQWPTEQEAA